MAIFNEATYENSIIELLGNLGYTHVYGPDVERDFHDPLMADELKNSLEMVNPNLLSTVTTLLFHLNVLTILLYL